jgi:hypothetical protein
MATRYTDCDIEVHLCNATDGMDTTGLDEAASNAKARLVVTDALLDAFPGRTVHVHMNYRTSGPTVIASYPDDVEREAIRAVVDRALENYDAWMVDAAPGEAEAGE